MEERNIESLKAAIAGLPTYEAPDLIWDNIEEALEKEEKDAPLKEAIKQLPIYEAPAAAWDNIESALPKKGLTAYTYFRMAAAAVVVLAVGLTLLFRPTDAEKVSYTVAEVEVFWSEIDWHEDEPSIEALVSNFINDPFAKQDENYESLLTQLDELNDAREELLTAIEWYGEDGQLVRQLSEIERDRSSVVQSMAKLL
ncbi:MAG: hypothetical protein AAFO07_10430 [Bacteroidota bacterium]